MACDESDPRVQMIQREMREAVSLESEKEKFDWKNLFYDRTDLRNTRRLILCFMIQFMQQFTGINVIAFYGKFQDLFPVALPLTSGLVTIVLEVNVGFDRPTSSLIAGFVQIAFWLGTFPPMYLVDRYGRRPTLLIGSIALTISMVLFVIGIALDTKVSNRLALAMLFVYEISFGMSWNSLPWLIAPEITPLHLRHVGSAIGPFSEWLWTFVCILAERTCKVLY
jgi:MFS family permease